MVIAAPPTHVLWSDLALRLALALFLCLAAVSCALEVANGVVEHLQNPAYIILVTDGVQTAGGTIFLAIDTAAAIKANGIKIAAIGYGPQADADKLMQLASEPTSLYYQV